MYSILIIDDEPIVKIALRSILPWEEHGFSICGTASNGLEAMSLIEKHQPDVIITDLKMPEMDGLELIRTLKEKNYPGEILVLSNYEDFDSVRSALLLGAADYLLKIKISPDTLLACLNKTTEKLQEKADRKVPVPAETVSENRTRLLLSFFEGETSLSSFTGQNAGTDLRFMQEPCAVCYVTFEKFLSNEAFSISGKLLCDMILTQYRRTSAIYPCTERLQCTGSLFPERTGCRSDESRSARKKAVQPLHHVPVLCPGYAISGKSSRL